MKFFNNRSDIAILIIFIAIDAFCLYQYTVGVGLHLPMAIVTSLVTAIILDIFSYIASFYGVGRLLEIGKYKNLDNFISDRNKARIIAVMACLFVIVIQVFLIGMRHGQISDKISEYDSARARHEATLQEDNFESQRARNIFVDNPPRYGGSYGGSMVIDYLSIIVPVLTTILSFVIGLMGAKYEGLEKLELEANKIREELIKKQKELDDLNNKAQSCINELLQISGGDTDLRKVLLDNEGKNSKELKAFNEKLEENLRRGAQDMYEDQVKKLYAGLQERQKEICIELSRNAHNPAVILDMDLNGAFQKRLEELKTPIILKIIEGNSK